MNKIILIFIAFIVIYGTYKKANCFDLFVEGAKEGFTLFIPLFTALLALMFFINMMIKTGLVQTICQIPIFKNVSSELLSMMFLRPFSSSGSLLLLDQIYQQYGLNHFFSMIATFIQSSTDTTLYVASLYLGSLGIKNDNKAVGLGLFLDALAILFAFIMTIIFF